MRQVENRECVFQEPSEDSLQREGMISPSGSCSHIEGGAGNLDESNLGEEVGMKAWQRSATETRRLSGSCFKQMRHF